MFAVRPPTDPPRSETKTFFALKLFFHFPFFSLCDCVFFTLAVPITGPAGTNFTVLMSIDTISPLENYICEVRNEKKSASGGKSFHKSSKCIQNIFSRGSPPSFCHSGARPPSLLSTVPQTLFGDHYFFSDMSGIFQKSLNCILPKILSGDFQSYLRFFSSSKHRESF